ncbi:hypothetical protein ACLESO_01760 [Pyxidicoccus sp. 3LG]
MWQNGRWTGESDEALFAGIRYDPAPSDRFGRWIPDAAGHLRFEDEARLRLHMDERERRLVEVLRRLRVATGPHASALRREVRSLSIVTLPRLEGPFDVSWLTGLTALEQVFIISNTGIVNASALAELPSLRHATLYAYSRNRICDLDGIARSRSLESLDLYFGSTDHLRALSGLRTLRRLRIIESQAYSLSGIEDLPIEELELDIGRPGTQVDLAALASLRSLRSLTARGELTLASAKAIAKSQASVLRFPYPPSEVDPAAIAALPDADEVSLSAHALARTDWTGRLPLTSLWVNYLDDATLRQLTNAPRLRTLRIIQLEAVDLAPLADLPMLRGLRFNSARELRSLDRVPQVTFLEDPRTPEGPNRLVLTNAPLVSLKQIGHLRGVEHLDLRGCTALTSLSGVEGMHALRTIDLRECPGPLDMSALEALPSLRAVMVNHRGPPGPFPPGIQERVVRSNLRGLARRLHREAVAQGEGRDD